MMAMRPRMATASLQIRRSLHTTLVNVYCKPGTKDAVVAATVRQFHVMAARRGSPPASFSQPAVTAGLCPYNLTAITRPNHPSPRAPQPILTLPRVSRSPTARTPSRSLGASASISSSLRPTKTT